ncbi:hypothetical protein OKA04_17970 [Luteolibacter flavescens]|uniref:Uncharacterized protein n=1 Tax=Luteolibacter flavescens TaxID=1859460 RepID=A0ABT3FSR5_9BACT|nr:hypothetical protein [Luteolibacter flavescens]MCW1886631.1 hypothetical protein [Luteolibacter flavescens]
MNLLPIETYLLLIVIIPVGVCLAKWRHSLSWWSATAACAAISWVYFNLWMAVLDPPDNGFANAVYFVTGWAWLLLPFALVAPIFRLIESRCPGEATCRMVSIGYRLCLMLTGAIVIWNLIGNMGKERAIVEARRELREHGYEPVGEEVPHREFGGWIIRYPDSDFGEIRLTRNGRMSWIGGQG